MRLYLSMVGCGVVVQSQEAADTAVIVIILISERDDQAQAVEVGCVNCKIDCCKGCCIVLAKSWK